MHTGSPIDQDQSDYIDNACAVSALESDQRSTLISQHYSQSTKDKQ